MRLGKQIVELVHDVTHVANTQRRRLSVPAPSRHLAAAMFHAVDGHIQEMGGRPATGDLAWEFPNGSVIQIEPGDAGGN